MTVWDSMALNTPHTEREIRSIHETGAGDLPTKLDGFPLLEEAIKEHYGQRCDEYMAGCPCCDTWAELDRLRAIRAAEAREMAQDGEPAPGSTTEPENATCPSAGGFGGFVRVEPLAWEDWIYGDGKAQSIFGVYHVWGDYWRAPGETSAGISADDPKAAAQADYEARIFSALRSIIIPQAILTAIAAEKAEWPHAGSMHDGARMACDAIAERVKQLMGEA